MKATVDADARLNLQDIVDCLGIDSTSVSRILNERLGYRKVSARWIPHILRAENEIGRLQYSKVLLQINRNCDLI